MREVLNDEEVGEVMLSLASSRCRERMRCRISGEAKDAKVSPLFRIVVLRINMSCFRIVR